MKIIREHLERGEEMKLSGFGIWRVRQKAARPGRNPKTGKAAEVGARKVVTFKISGILQDRLNGKNNPLK